jgi:predicted DNA-binding transcriptional regulator YafY
MALRSTARFTSTDSGAPELLPAPTSEATILAAATAQHLRQRLTIRYRSWRGAETARQVDPYGLVQHLGSWYIAGWCHLREDIRVFRLDRITALRLERETFEPPENFDARDHIVRSLALAPYRWHIEVVIDAPLAQVAPLVPDGVAAATCVPDGVLLESRMDRLKLFARFLAGLGFPFRVVRPAELHDEIRRIALVLLESAAEDD